MALRTGLSLAFLLIALATNTAHAQRAEYSIVSSPEYEGAIVPGPEVLLEVRARLRLPPTESPLTPWLPGPPEITMLEKTLATFVKTAATDPAAVSTLGKAQPWQLQGLAQTIRGLKRQYFGFRQGNTRRIAVHLFVETSSHWRSAPVAMDDGNCQNSWFNFNVDENRITAFTCEGR